jgi:hypothetical protein
MEVFVHFTFNKGNSSLAGLFCISLFGLWSECISTHSGNGLAFLFSYQLLFGKKRYYA